MGECAAGEPRTLLVLVTPERVASSKRLMAQLEKLYKAGRLARFVVDEAHCCTPHRPTTGRDLQLRWCFESGSKTSLVAL